MKRMQSPTEREATATTKKSENRHKNVYLVQPPDRANGRSANHEFPSEWHRQHDTQKIHYSIRIVIRTRKKEIEKRQ